MMAIHEDYISCTFNHFYYFIFWRFKNSLKYHQSSSKFMLYLQHNNLLNPIMHATCSGHVWTCVKNILQFVKSHTSYNCHSIGLIHIFCSLLTHECIVGFNKIVVFDGNTKIDCWFVIAQRDEFRHNDQFYVYPHECAFHIQSWHFWTNGTLASSTEHDEHKISRQYDFFCYSSFPFSFLTFNTITITDIKQL
jgi:hypothetical protein